MRLVVAMPCYDSITRQTAVSLAMMSFMIGKNPIDGMTQFGIDWLSTSNLPEARHTLAVRALKKHDATHILWVDSDMAFPADSFHRLLARDVEIVGVNYPRRVPPHTSTATDLDGKSFTQANVGMSKAGVIGFGLLLTRMSVFEGEYDMPLFAHHDEEGYCTEDVTFCKKAIARGHDVWVDHDLSREIKHVGSVAFGFEDMMEGESR